MKKFFIILIMLFTVFLCGTNIYAQGAEIAGEGGIDPKGTCAGDNCLKNPLGESVDIPILAGKIINAVLGIVGSIALVMFIYGGFSWMTAAGNQEAVKKGSNILIWATIGLIIIFSAYALVNFIFKAIGG